jgi:CRISPR system Cascade subunit CasA
VLTLEERFNTRLDNADAKVFPWMGPTNESSNDKRTFPEQVNELQMYWGTPRRIRLTKKDSTQTCDVCGITAPVWTSYRAKNYGVSFSSTWKHSLSPYRRQVEPDATISLIATKGKQGGFSYPDWLSLTIGNDENETSADVLRSFFEHKVFHASGLSQTRIWCFGYDMDNMKARCWYDQTMPLIALTKDFRAPFVECIQKAVAAAKDVAKLLRDQIKAAWFERPKDAKGDTTFIQSSFWEETEEPFFRLTEKIRVAIESGEPREPILAEWRRIIIDTAERLFDRFALQNTDEVKNMKRIAESSKALSNILNSPKTKTIQALK